MFRRSRKQAQRNAEPENVHAYWPDIGWVLNGDGREFHEYTEDELRTLGRFSDEWVQLPVVTRLPITYGDGRVYIIDHDGQRFLLITGNEYGSSAAKVTPEIVQHLASKTIASGGTE